MFYKGEEGENGKCPESAFLPAPHEYISRGSPLSSHSPFRVTSRIRQRITGDEKRRAGTPKMSGNFRDPWTCNKNELLKLNWGKLSNFSFNIKE